MTTEGRKQSGDVPDSIQRFIRQTERDARILGVLGVLLMLAGVVIYVWEVL